jgi:hypothetical protein
MFVNHDIGAFLDDHHINPQRLFGQLVFGLELEDIAVLVQVHLQANKKSVVPRDTFSPELLFYHAQS